MVLTLSERALREVDDTIDVVLRMGDMFSGVFDKVAKFAGDKFPDKVPEIWTSSGFWAAPAPNKLVGVGGELGELS